MNFNTTDAIPSVDLLQESNFIIWQACELTQYRSNIWVAHYKKLKDVILMKIHVRGTI